MNKRFISIIAAIIVLVGGFLWVTKPKEDTTNTTAQSSNHIKGEGAKKVTLVEYGDFQCPACGAYFPIVERVVETYKSDITFQFRNFPLESLHQNARAASRAVEAAHLQGKFWEMYAALYTNQEAWSTSSDPLSIFTGYATQVGISDTTRFTDDYKSAAVNDVINADMKEAQKLGLTGTPTFILNGKIVDTPSDEASFTKLITDAIAAAQ